MALSCRFATLSLGQKISSLMMLLIALHAMAFHETAMVNGISNVNTTLQGRLAEALKEKGGFIAAATFLGAVDLSRLLPESSTVLVPMDQDVTQSGLQVSTFNTALPILQYHVITKRLAFGDLQLLPEGGTLETLLPNNTVIITSNNTSNFSVDDVPLSHKDLFLASSTAVHGIRGVLDFSKYGQKNNLHNSPAAAPPARSPIGGGRPARPPIPPFAGSSSTDNETQSSTSPAASGNETQSSPSTVTEGFNSSVTPSITPAPTQVSTNVSSSVSSSPVSFPKPPGPPTKHPSPSAVTPKPHSQSPSNPQQDASPFFSTNLSPSSAHLMKPWPITNIFSAVLLPALLLAKTSKTRRLTLMLYLTLVLMVATPASGEMNVDMAEVLRSKGGFGYAATYLQALDMHRVMPNRSTVLVPTDAAIVATGLIYNTLGGALPTLKYHVVTKRLTFEDLQKLPVGTTLETLLPGSSLVITSNESSNYTVNGVLLSHPDIFCSDGTAVHGISGVMNFSSVSHERQPAAGTPGIPHLQTSPLPPRLILPLPESAGPSAAPPPVSGAASVFKSLNVSRFTVLMLVLVYTRLFLFTLKASFSPNHCRNLPATQFVSSSQRAA